MLGVVCLEDVFVPHLVALDVAFLEPFFLPDDLDRLGDGGEAHIDHGIGHFHREAPDDVDVGRCFGEFSPRADKEVLHFVIKEGIQNGLLPCVPVSAAPPVG